MYSFGLRDDWSFEEAMARMGCKVMAFDPTVNLSIVQNPSRNIIFHKIGVVAKEVKGKESYWTLDRIIKDNGHLHTKISFLKMDVEGAELAGLPVWISSGILRNVVQFALEIHLDLGYGHIIQNTREFLKNFKELQIQENFCIFNWDPNLCWKNVNMKTKNYDHHHLFEIVLKKINPLNSCCA